MAEKSKSGKKKKAVEGLRDVVASVSGKPKEKSDL